MELTARQREVLEGVAAGESNDVIGERLGISGGTVRSHLRLLMTKCDVNSRAALVAVAFREGVLS